MTVRIPFFGCLCVGKKKKVCRLIGLLASWLDHTRDLLHLINLKRDEMPRPIVGIGHSMGGAQLYA